MKSSNLAQALLGWGWRCLWGALSLALAACGGGGGSAGNSSTGTQAVWSDYLPLGLDNRWVYQADDDVQVVTVLSSTTTGGTTQAVTRVSALQAAWSANQDVQLDATGVSANEEEDGDLVLQGRNGWTVGREQTLASGTDSSADWDDDAVPDKVSYQSKLLVLASEAI